MCQSKQYDINVINDGYIDVGDGCWRPNVLVTGQATGIKYQSPTLHSGIY